MYNCFHIIIMILGWKQMEEVIVDSTIAISGYDVLKNMCNAFYDYSTNNKGVFEAMLWYNKYENVEKDKATMRLFDIIFEIMKPLDITDDNINYIIRTLRSFLEGFALLVNNNSFGSPISIKDSFEIKIK